jgi:hypothetical protein
MAMLSQSMPVSALGCPAGVCRGLEQRPARASWKAIVAGFAAGAFMMSWTAILAARAEAPSSPRSNPAQQVAAEHWKAYVAEQTPREIPREWRYEIKGVKLDGMFRKKR